MGTSRTRPPDARGTAVARAAPGRAGGARDGRGPPKNRGPQPDRLCDPDRPAGGAFPGAAPADDVEVFGRRLELVRGDLEELAPGLARRFKHRAAEAVGDL